MINNASIQNLKYTPGPEEMQWMMEFREPARSKTDYHGKYCRSTKEGWYIESQCHGMLMTYEIQTIRDWCKHNCTGYWTVEWDHIYLESEDDAILFKLTWI